MDKTSTQELLNAEEQAHKLVEELTRLRNEAESYREARGALSEVSVGIANTFTELQNITEKIGEVVATMRKLGTPAIIEAQSSLATQIEGLGTSVRDQGRDSVDKVIARLDTLEMTISNLPQTEFFETLATCLVEAQEKLQKVFNSIRIFTITGCFISLVLLGLIVWQLLQS